MRITRKIRARLSHRLHQASGLSPKRLQHRHAFFPLLAVAAPTLLIVCVMPATSDTELPAQVSKLEQSLGFIHSSYLDHTNLEALTDAAIQGMLGSLDPYSYYQNETEARRELAEMNAKTCLTTGLTVTWIKNNLVVWQVDSGSVAEFVEILPGDRIERLQNIPASELQEDQANALLNPSFSETGFADEKRPIEVTIYRPETGKANLYRLYPRRKDAEIAPRGFCSDDTTVTIRFDDFHLGTSREVVGLMQYFRNRGARRFIFDLRHNRGGFVVEAVELSDQLCGTAQRLLSIRKGAAGDHLQEYDGHSIDQLRSMPIVLLVGEHTASAAEIFAGILQDLDRAMIVGEPTTGKGLVMERRNTNDGSSLMIATGRYYLPSGRFVQRSYRGGDFNTPRRAVREDFANLAHDHDSLYGAEARDTFRTRTGRKVFGGEGIIPDFFVRHSPTLALGNWATCNYALFLYVERYLEAHSEEIVHQYSLKTITQLRLPETLVKDLAAMSMEWGGQANIAELQKDEPNIRLEIIAEIAKRMYGEVAWRREILASDPAYRTAIRTLPTAMAFATPAEH